MTISEAAKLLSVAPMVLRQWQQRFNFPPPHATTSGGRYALSDILMMHEAIQESASIAQAVAEFKVAEALMPLPLDRAG